MCWYRSRSEICQTIIIVVWFDWLTLGTHCFTTSISGLAQAQCCACRSCSQWTRSVDLTRVAIAVTRYRSVQLPADRCQLRLHYIQSSVSLYTRPPPLPRQSTVSQVGFCGLQVVRLPVEYRHSCLRHQINCSDFHLSGISRLIVGDRVRSTRAIRRTHCARRTNGTIVGGEEKGRRGGRGGSTQISGTQAQMPFKLNSPAGPN